MITKAHYSTLLFKLLVLLSPSRGLVLVQGWGKEGHEIVANLAWKLLSNTTQERITTILSSDQAYQKYKEDPDHCPGCSPIGMVADWADQVKYTSGFHWSAALHYIDVQDDAISGGCPVTKSLHGDTLLDDRPEWVSPARATMAVTGTNKTHSGSCIFNYTRDCENDHCVAGAIVNYTHPLQSPRDDADDDNDTLVQQSLKFLVHFVGDIHQPLHCARKTDMGGNTIHVHFDSNRVEEKESFFLRNRFSRRVPMVTPQKKLRKRHGHHDADNLHAVWDDGLLEKGMRLYYESSRENVEKDLFGMITSELEGSTETWQRWTTCANGSNHDCTVAWGEEGLEHALFWAYRNVDGTEIVDHTDLDNVYFETRLPIVMERLACAGVRLAATLNALLDV